MHLGGVGEEGGAVFPPSISFSLPLFHLVLSSEIYCIILIGSEPAVSLLRMHVCRDKHLRGRLLKGPGSCLHPSSCVEQHSLLGRLGPGKHTAEASRWTARSNKADISPLLSQKWSSDTPSQHGSDLDSSASPHLHSISRPLRPLLRLPLTVRGRTLLLSAETGIFYS